jgi:hypothetical protein
VEYLPDPANPARRFSLSYQELREEHERMVTLDDAGFVAELPAAAHLACIVGWLKELGPAATIGDGGIVHELVHLMHMGPSGTTQPLAEIRAQFARLLFLAP